MLKFAAAGLALVAIVAGPLSAKDSLGVFSKWAAFRDASVPRCYAISQAEEDQGQSDFEPYATIGTWPVRRIRSQVHFRLSRALRQNSRVSLRVGRASFVLVSGQADAWASDTAMDRAIVTAMRNAQTMAVSATDARGRRFSDRYRLVGAASAIDAATLACMRR
jgi:hypothetical protein